jgi:hypothetical protein
VQVNVCAAGLPERNALSTAALDAARLSDAIKFRGRTSTRSKSSRENIALSRS